VIRLRNLFLAGLVVLVPAVLTIWVVQILFAALDGFSQPLLRLYLGHTVPGVGSLLTAVIILTLGFITSFFVGQRLVEAGEYWISRIPIVRSVYSTTRQVVRGFSSGEGVNFQRPVLVHRDNGLMSLGFVTGEFALSDSDGTTQMASVYIPTNHLYLGDVFVVPASQIVEVEMSLEEGISALLSCGGSLPPVVKVGLPKERSAKEATSVLAKGNVP